MSTARTPQLGRPRRGLLLALTGTTVLLLTASPAWAHGNIDVADFYQGMLHPALHVEHVLAILALGFWSGQARGRGAWLAPISFIGATLIGAILGLLDVELIFASTLIYASMVVLGALVAAKLRLPVVFMVAIAVVFGLFHGWAHGDGVLESLEKPILYVLGIGVGLSLLLFYSAQLVIHFKASWIQVAVRIAGSWITAIGLLVLALHSR